MVSKRSWFNKAVLRLDLHNSWPIWAGNTLFWLVAASFIATNSYTLMERNLEMCRFWEGCTTLAVSFALPTYGCVVAVWLLRSLYQSRSALAIHALPADRRQMFATHLVSAIILNGIPSLVVTIYGLARYTGGESNLKMGLVAMACFLGVSWLTYLWTLGFGFFCGMITGQLPMVPILYLVLNFLAVGLSTVLDDLFRRFLPGYLSGAFLWEISQWLSPWFALGSALSWTDYKFAAWGTMVIYALAGTAFLGIAYHLYRRRPLERAGELIIYRPLRVEFRLGVAFCAAIFGSAFFQLLLGIKDSPISIYLLMVICAGVGLLGTRMLELKSFHVVNFRLLGEYGGVAAVLALMMVALNTGGLGYVTRVPQADRVKEISLSIGGSLFCGPLDLSWGQLVLDEPEQIQQFCQWHREYSQLLLQNPNYPDEDYARLAGEDTADTEEAAYAWDRSYRTGYTYAHIMVYYDLENGGNLRRSYYVPMDRQEAADPTSPDGQLARLLAGVEMTEILRDWAPYAEVYMYEDGTQYAAGQRNQRLINALVQDLEEQGWTLSLLDQQPFWEQEAVLEISPDYALAGTQNFNAQGGIYSVRVSEEYTPRTLEVLQQEYRYKG